MKIFGVPVPFTEKAVHKVEKKYDLNGNRFYNEYIRENGMRAEEKPLKVAAALRAGLMISEHLGRMPIHIKRIIGDRKEDERSRIADLLSRRPNSWQTPMEFVESVTLKAIFEGVGRAYIARDGIGQVHELVPILDGGMTVRDDITFGKLYSGHIPGYGFIKDATRSDFIEIGNPHWTSICRIDVAYELRDVFKLARALQARQDGDASVEGLRGLLMFADELDPESAQEAREAMGRLLKGVAVLDSGATFQQLQASSADLQLLQTRQFAIEEIARAFGIHPLMLGHDAAGQSLTRVDDVADYHINFTLGGWVERWEQAIAFSLLRPDQVVEFETEKLFRMSVASRMGWLTQALGGGGAKQIVTEDEARVVIGMNPMGEAFWAARNEGQTNDGT